MTTPAAPWDLVDDRLGIIPRVEGVELHPALPRSLRVAAASLAALDVHGPGAGQASPGGAVWWDAAAARSAAIAEAAERYCAWSVPATLRRASYRQLRRQAVDVIDPADLALYSDGQYAAAGFPFVPLTRDLPVRWAQGTDLDSGAPVWAPASLVYLRHLPVVAGDEPPTHVPINAGLAAGASPAGAHNAAMEELLERHCVATAWLRGDPLPRLAPPAWLHALLGGPGGPLSVRIHLFPNIFDLPVAGVIVADDTTGVLGMGTALRPRLAAAVRKAAAEAVVSCQAAYELQRDGGAVTAQLAGGGVKAWRADRAYRRCYRADWRDVVDVFCHVQLYLDPTMRGPLDDRLDGPGPVALEQAPCRPLGPGETYLARLRAHGYRAIAVDLTTPDIAACGLSVARVVVPGLRSTAPAAFPSLGGPRGAAITAAARPPCALPLPHA